MIILVETNFVLELAFRQKESSHCERLVELAAEGIVELAIPACSLFEPYETLVRRSKNREKMLEAFTNEVNQLARSEFYKELPNSIEEIVKPIVGSSNVYEESLRKALISVLKVATIIPLSSSVMGLAFEFQQAAKISPQDSVVAASVALFARERTDGPKFFANQNVKDFVEPIVKAHFQQGDCALLNCFRDARRLADAARLSRAS